MDSIEKKVKLQAFQTVIEFEGHDIGVKAAIRPRIDPPHVSIDAGNLFFYARPARVEGFRLFDDDAEDVTDYYGWFERDREAIKAIILDHYLHPERNPLLVTAEQSAMRVTA